MGLPLEEIICDSCNNKFSSWSNTVFYRKYSVCPECLSFYKKSNLYCELDWEKFDGELVKKDWGRENKYGRIIGQIHIHKDRLDIDNIFTVISGLIILIYFLPLFFTDKFSFLYKESSVKSFYFLIFFLLILNLLIKFIDFIWTKYYNKRVDNLNNKNRRPFGNDELKLKNEIRKIYINNNYEDLKSQSVKNTYLKIKENQLEVLSQKIDKRLINGEKVEINSKIKYWTQKKGIIEIGKSNEIDNNDERELNEKEIELKFLKEIRLLISQNKKISELDILNFESKLKNIKHSINTNDYYFAKGLIHEVQGKHSKAIDNYKKIALPEEDINNANRLIATNFFELKDYTESLIYYLKYNPISESDKNYVNQFISLCETLKNSKTFKKKSI
jgi:hypothetical protein